MSAILQPGSGRILGQHYLPSRVDQVHWGLLPNRTTPPVLTIGSGDVVTVDTVSHEGMLGDQGRDPAAYFAQFGVKEVLRDAIDIAASDLANGPADGPHIVTGPIAIKGAKPGHILRIDVLDLSYRVPYGIISNRHGYGALAGEYPEDDKSTPTRHLDTMVRDGTVSHYAWLDVRDGHDIGVIEAGPGRTVGFRLAPFLGIMGTARDTDQPVHSVPPGEYGGNIDIKHITAGATLFLPVLVPAALFYVGDPHFAQGNGEVALTALEASLRATLRLTVVPPALRTATVGGATGPVGETATHWIPSGLDQDLDEAMRKAVRNAIAFLHQRFGVPRAVALAYLSAAGDFEVSQVVDQVKGVHCMIAKADWKAWV